MHTHSSEHTHTPWTHTGQWAAIYAARPGAVEGSVSCSRAPQSWYWRRRESCTFTPPPTIPAGRDSNLWPLGYESDSLTIRPRLPPNYIQIWKKYVHTHTHTLAIHPKCLYSTTELNWVVHILNEGLLWQKLSCFSMFSTSNIQCTVCQHFSTEGTSKHD